MVVEEAEGSGADVMWFEPGVVLKDVKSSVWGFFKFKGTQVKGPNKEKVYCTICVSNKKASAKVSYCGGTSNLSAHLKYHHPAEYSKKEEEKKSGKITAYMTIQTDPKSGYRWPKSSTMWKTATKNLAIWLCRNSRPSNLVLDEGFRAFISFLCPQNEVPCPKTISNAIRDL